MIRVVPIPAFNDNYIWTLINDRNSMCCVVDPGDANAVIHYLEQHSLTLDSVLVTHHHFDHTGGIGQLKAKYHCQIFGPNNTKINNIDHRLSERSTFALPALNLSFSVLEVPGHTLDHIAYLTEDRLFCGDTLFSVGCGRLFEGTPQQMLTSLNKFKSLPDQTSIYPTHEYTTANIQFAKAVEPSNTQLTAYEAKVASLRERGKPSLPTTLEAELTFNPFMRTQEEQVINAAETFVGLPLSTESDVFAAIRQWKDEF